MVLIHCSCVIGSLTSFMTVCVHGLLVSTEALNFVTCFYNTGTTPNTLHENSKKEVCAQLCMLSYTHTHMVDWGHKERLIIGMQG